MTKNEIIETLQTWINNADDRFDLEEQGKVEGWMDAIELLEQMESEDI